MKNIDKKAFTLIELLVVIAVIGILVLLVAPRFTGYTQKAERIRIQHDVKVMEEEIGTVLINGDDDFNKWENNSKDYLNQLAQDNDLFENKGYATELETKDGHYKIIPEEYKDKINTKLKGTFYANIGGKVYYEHGKGPGYSDEEIDDLIKQHDFIPVADADELNNVRNATVETYGKGTKWEGKYLGGLDKKYIQVKNVDLSGYSEEGWKPIGTSSSSRFRGTYDGGNYVITGLVVNGGENNYQGLFGYTQRATISNVGLIDNKVTGRYYVGGLVGSAGNRSTIINSYATGSTTGNRQVGGLVGYANGSMIENSYATGSVEGTKGVGGLVGHTYSSTIENTYATGSVKGSEGLVGGLVGWGSGTIENSYATGSVTGTGDVGGLVGQTTSSTKISNSYATGSVIGLNRAGGLVGLAEGGTEISSSYATGSVTATGGAGGTTSAGGLVGSASAGGGSAQGSTIDNSYATGSVESTEAAGGLVGYISSSFKISNSYATGAVEGTNIVGGLVGQASGATEITNSYWDKETTLRTGTRGGGIGKTTDEMKNADTYSGWDTDVWNIVNGEYPTLR